jgi:cyanophycinase
MDHYRNLGIPAEVIPIKTRDDAEREPFSERLADASVVFFSGGNPAYLARLLARTRFWRTLLEAMDRGLAYAGCSAGVACLGEAAPDSAARSFSDGQLWQPGLRMFPKVYLGPHWDALDRFVPGLKDFIVASVPPDCRLLAIDERTAVVGDGATWTVMGSGSAHLLETAAWREAGPGQTMTAALTAPAPAAG